MDITDALHDSNAHELGAFLRARRESLDPGRLGIARGGRKRTPGLRREDVAALADIGITWYTKLEQGRPIRVSSRVLAAVAGALQCTEAETRHLFTLAGLKQPERPAAPAGCPALSTMQQRLLDQLDPIPALIQNARYDILGFNQSYCRMVGVDLARIAPEDRNCIYLALTHSAWQASLANWEDAVPRMVAQFRSAMAEHRHEPLWETLLDRFMAASPAFRDAWQRYEVRAIENQLKTFSHPRLGLFTLQQNNWWSAARDGDRLLAYLPVDEFGERVLRELAQSA
ncbi:MAG: helix-turn-helix domain-containing protein [Paludibacterium sp.]|uniref:helix-turn-helix transcriptional regulator n=1 Tax=Paludibacterium sp. TaxID=1917523 RepID=UPI0025ED846C|nr:helix-turn-helix transcriptional regulator [Paludibacterium sp.]MBV8048489.1 helix-turn-helix domain-containing protein [Paludibacterium sp.]MBV8647349.1 helix-turn-helix domain-containing protein [Paludibacterium sp.]